jgi:hypothetical protein
LFDPIALFNLIVKFVLKQLDNQYKTAVLVAKQLPILQFHQDDQVGNATYNDCSTTRAKVASQPGVCYYTPDLFAIKAMELSLRDFDMLTKLTQRGSLSWSSRIMLPVSSCTTAWPIEEECGQ